MAINQTEPTAAEPIVAPVQEPLDPFAPEPIAIESETPEGPATLVTPEPTESIEPTTEPVKPAESTAEDLRVRRDMQTRQQELDAREDQLFEQGLTNATNEYAAMLQTQYQLPSEQARTLATKEANNTRSVYQLRRQQQEIITGATSKLELVLQLAEEHGLGLDGARKLMQYNSGDEMTMGARLLRTQSVEAEASNTRIKSLEDRLAKYEKKPITPQNFDSNMPGLVAAATTSDNIDKLYMDHEIAHPNQPNPYEAAYRKVVNR